MWKKWFYLDCEKDASIFAVGELQQEGRTSPFSTSVGNVHMGSSDFCSEHVREGHGRAASTDLGATHFGQKPNSQM